MTKKELQKRIKTTKREKEIAYWQCDNNRDQSVVVSLNRRYHILVEKLEAEELALKQLEDQEKCCGNCANRKDENGECEFLTDQINIENDSEVSLCVSLVNYCRDGWKERKEE